MGTVRIHNTHPTQPYFFSYGGQVWLFQPLVGEYRLGQRTIETRMIGNTKAEMTFENKTVDGVSTLVPVGKKFPEGWEDAKFVSRNVRDMPIKVSDKKVRNFHDIPDDMAKFLFNGKNASTHKGHLKRAASIEDELDAEAAALEKKRLEEAEQYKAEIERLKSEIRAMTPKDSVGSAVLDPPGTWPKP